MCQNVGTLLKIQNFGGVDNSYKYGAVRSTTEIQTWQRRRNILRNLYYPHIIYLYLYLYLYLYDPHIIYIYYPHPSQRTSSRLFRQSFLMSHVEPTGTQSKPPIGSLQCLAALHDAHNHGLKWPHSVISDFATGKIHHFIWGIVPLFFLRLWTMFHCHAMENHMFFTVNR